MTLDQLARALRGMPRSAPMLVATAEGLRPIVLVRPGRVGCVPEDHLRSLFQGHHDE